MPVTRKNARDPDSPYLTRDAIGKGRTFGQRFPDAHSKSIKVMPVTGEPPDTNVAAKKPKHKAA
jgi:hypothetical protein